jgi:hypothetical protein
LERKKLSSSTRFTHACLVQQPQDLGLGGEGYSNFLICFCILSIKSSMPVFVLHHFKVLCPLAVMDNYKNVPQFLYGLSSAQMEMFMNDDNPYNRQSQKVTEVSDVI